jgi:TATA-box binding protein (TBP) (component of TFIID and TFIIIB)
MDCPTATSYKVSTITAIGGIGSLIHIDTFFQKVPLVPTHNCKEEGIVFVEYGKVKTERIVRGERPTKKNKTLKRFDNQATVIIKTNYNDRINFINMKVFRNGNLQMTGVKLVDEGSYAIDMLIGILKKMSADILKTPEALSNDKYRVCLINSDFKIDMQIKREFLHVLLIHEFPGIKCSYESCIYPGVKIEYYHSDKDRFSPVCSCDSECRCHKVTIAVFRSGCIIITGAEYLHQIDDAYEFIVGFLRNNQEDLRQIEHEFVLNPAPKHISEKQKASNSEEKIRPKARSKPKATIDTFLKMNIV